MTPNMGKMMITNENALALVLSDEDKICLYCKHRDVEHAVKLPVKRPWGCKPETCAPCLVDADTCDLGPGVHLYAHDGHCFKEDRFEANAIFWLVVGNPRILRMQREKREAMACAI